jgi:hypothetical protein
MSCGTVALYGRLMPCWDMTIVVLVKSHENDVSSSATRCFYDV